MKRFRLRGEPSADELLRRRTTQEVFDDHVRLMLAGDRTTDLARNYGDDSIVLTSVGVFRGRRGANYIGDWIHCGVPFAEISVRNALVEGDVAFLEWDARSEHADVTGGANSYVIRDGRIVTQTVHFLIVPREERS